MMKLSSLFSTLTAPFRVPSPTSAPSARPQHMGRAMLVLLLGFFVWAVFAPLSKGVVATGIVVVDSQRKTLQHLEGGVIRTIPVREGMRVRQGEVVLELDDTQARATRDMVRMRYFSRLAAVDALKALASNQAQVAFSPDLLKAKAEGDAAELMHLQENIFRVLRAEYRGKQNIARQRIGQLEQQLQGLGSLHQASQRQVALLEKEVARLETLMQRRLIESSMLAERLQQLSQQNGELGRIVAEIAATQTAIGEARMQVLQVDKEWQQSLAKQLSENQEALVEARNQLDSAENVMQRTVIRAPIAGAVLALKATTVGGVLSPGNPIMDIVPEDDKLVVEARVSPLDVDAVSKGMQAQVRFTAFKAKSTPDLNGDVDTVSADILKDPNTGESFYLMRVKVGSSELGKLNGLVVVPGMPADIFVDGGSRTLLQYVLDPVSSLFRKSLRED